MLSTHPIHDVTLTRAADSVSRRVTRVQIFYFSGKQRRNVDGYLHLTRRQQRCFFWLLRQASASCGKTEQKGEEKINSTVVAIVTAAKHARLAVMLTIWVIIFPAKLFESMEGWSKLIRGLDVDFRCRPIGPLPSNRLYTLRSAVRITFFRESARAATSACERASERAAFRRQFNYRAPPPTTSCEGLAQCSL